MNSFPHWDYCSFGIDIILNYADRLTALPEILDRIGAAVVKSACTVCMGT